MGYRAWQAHGRQVRKGERGLTILAPVTRKTGERSDRRNAPSWATARQPCSTTSRPMRSKTRRSSTRRPRRAWARTIPTGLTEALVAVAESTRLHGRARRDRLRRRAVQLREPHDHGAGVALAGRPGGGALPRGRARDRARPEQTAATRASRRRSGSYRPRARPSSCCRRSGSTRRGRACPTCAAGPAVRQRRGAPARDDAHRPHRARPARAPRRAVLRGSASRG